MAQKALTRLLRCVEALRLLDPEMQLQTVTTLLTIADNPGITQRELAAKTAISDGSISRNCAALGEVHRKGLPGLKLVEAHTDVMDRRIRKMHLTKRGERTLADILTLLDK